MRNGYETILSIADTLSQTGMPTIAGRSSDSFTELSTGGCAGWPKQAEAKLTEQTNKRSLCILAATSIHPAVLHGECGEESRKGADGFGP